MDTASLWGIILGNALQSRYMTTSAAVRQKLVEALSLDLVGPDATADVADPFNNCGRDR